MIPLTTKQVLKKLGGDKNTKTITYDGSGVGIDIFGDGKLYLKVSDETFDFSTVKSISLIIDGKTWGFEKDDLVIDPGTAESFPTIIILVFGQVVAFYAPPGIELDAGLYIAADSHAYVSRIEFETIHPIDQKYLPPMGSIETFNLPDYGIDLLSMLFSGQTSLEQDNTAFITDVSNAVTAGKIPAVRIDDMLSDVFITAYKLGENVDFSLCGSMSGGWVKVDVIIVKDIIFVFTTALGA